MPATNTEPHRGVLITVQAWSMVTLRSRNSEQMRPAYFILLKRNCLSSFYCFVFIEDAQRPLYFSISRLSIYTQFSFKPN